MASVVYVATSTTQITAQTSSDVEVSTTNDVTEVVISNLQGPQGTPGASGVVSVVSPITNTGTASEAIVGINASSANTANYVVQRDANKEFVAGAITIDTTLTPTSAPGKLFWDGGGTVNLGLAGGNVDVALGENLVSYVTNAEATTLAVGEVVYVFGAAGDRPSVKRASNTTEVTSSKTLGIVAESIAANQIGFVVTRGIIGKLALGSYTAGQPVYLGSTAGTFTSTKPTAPANLVSLGWVIRANNGNGQIYLNVQNGFELEELHDVAVTAATNGQVLTYDSTTHLWKNANPASNIPTSRTIATTAPLTGGGDLSADRTLGVTTATTSATGVVQLSDSTSTTSSTLAATPTAVKSAYDLATTANATANAAIPLTQKAAANGVATLDASGLVPTAQMPPIAISETFVVASQAAMLALNAQVGDVAVRTDISQTFILQTTPATTLGNWVQILTPAAPVQSVDGFTGTVSLTSVYDPLGAAATALTSANVYTDGKTVTATAPITKSGTLGTGLTIGVNSATPTTTGVVYGLTNNDTTPFVTIDGDDYPLQNTALGYKALDSESGFNNVAVGVKALENNTDGSNNVAVGYNALNANTTGGANFALGSNSLSVNTTGFSNIGVGDSSLLSNTTGTFNTGIGSGALQSNTTGYSNTGIGGAAGLYTTTGYQNISIGTSALQNNITGYNNTVIGVNSGLDVLGSGNVLVGFEAGKNETGSNKLYIANNQTTSLIVGDFNAQTLIVDGALTANSFKTPSGTSSQFLKADGSVSASTATPTTTGVVYGLTENDDPQNANTALGYKALDSQSGLYNLAIGVFALENNTGGNNLAIGPEALRANTTGSFNSGIGSGALFYNTTGEGNIAIGSNSLFSNTTGSNNTVIGEGAGANNVTGSNNVFFGKNAGYNETGSNKLYIANNSTTSLIVGDFSAKTLIVDGAVTATSYAVPSGTSSGFLKANGTVDSTAYAPLASPSLTGTPLSTTAAVDTNTTQIATTAYVVGQGYLKSATATTTYAPLASPTFTGTVTIPAGSSISGVPYLGTANTFTGGVQQITTASAATKGLIIRAISVSQSANLFEIQDGSGNASFRIDSNSNVILPTTGTISWNGVSPIARNSSTGQITLVLQNTSGASFLVGAGNAGAIPFIVRGAASQTANLQEWQNSAGTVRTYIDSSGRLASVTAGAFGGLALGDAFLGVQTTATVVGLIVKGAASQTADLQQWQNSAGTVLANVTSSGKVNLFGAATSTNDLITLYSGLSTAGNTVSIKAYPRGGGAAANGSASITFGGSSGPSNYIAFSVYVSGAESEKLRVSNEGMVLVNTSNAFLGTGGVLSQLGVANGAATTVGQVIRGAASQTANLQEWQNFSATTLTSITATGTINFASGNTSATATAGAITPPAQVTGYITMQIAGTTVKVPYYAA